MRDTPSRLEQCVVKIIAQLVKARQAAGLPIDGDLDARIGDQLSWAISNIRIRLDPEQNLPPRR